jgi:tetratricopeptide (TPR) repeat protein
VQVALRVADELEGDGRWQLAREQLFAVSEHAGAVLRADSLLLRRCALWERQQQPRRAYTCYREAQLESEEMRALRHYRLAVLDIDLHGAGAGRRAMVAVTLQYPGTNGAFRSLRGARALARETGGPAAEVGVLAHIVGQLRHRATAAGAPPGIRDLYLEALVAAARVHLEDLDDAAGAELLLERAIGEAEGNNWLDDAVFHRARALRALGRHEEALAHFFRIVNERETAWFFGSYDSSFLDDAYFERAEVLEELGRVAAARDAYSLLVEEVPRSRLADDAAFRAARLAGDRALLERFLLDFPDSRHVQAVRELLGAR